VVSYCCHKFGVLDFGLNLAQSCSTCSRAAGSPASPVQHGGRTSILLRLLRWRMASSLRSTRARKLFQSGRCKAACRGAADSGAHEKSRDHLHNLQQAPSDARQWIASVAPARKGRAQGQLVSIGWLLMSQKLPMSPPSLHSISKESLAYVLGTMTRIEKPAGPIKPNHLVWQPNFKTSKSKIQLQEHRA
jgi:hypothetical protein